MRIRFLLNKASSLKKINHYFCRYNEKLKEARFVGVKKGCVTGGAVGLIFFLIVSINGVGIWYAAKMGIIKGL